ncbi:MAG: gephyrin-like molybdotransferase Glp [Paracoccaceae bacterium]
MISVEEALERLFDLVAPLDEETVPLAEAGGRVLARPVSARRTQPPFAAAAMDGYALCEEDAVPGRRLTVIGESAAGRRFPGTVGPGEAVRIFTGAPMPEGADRVVIQEDVSRDPQGIVLDMDIGNGPHVRPAGIDFREGDRLDAPRRLSPADVALLAAMNLPLLPVTRRPVVALIATGDELVAPGELPGPDQIVASNGYGLKALLEGLGAEARLLPIARDTRESLRMAFLLAEGADLIVTIGGASVGDHDLVAPVAAEMGMKTAFYKVKMRPGKPLMAGRLNGTAMIGLPGNPVSAIVCGHVFLAPVIRHMLGLGRAPAPRASAALANALPANGPREHYMRARLAPDGIEVFPTQDSALLSVLSSADALVVRPPGDGPRAKGERVEYLPLGA